MKVPFLSDLEKALESNKWKEGICLIPLALICAFWLFKSANFPIHDYANSYFPARLAAEQTPPENVVFDIYDYNEYIWGKGYENEFADFYLNSPFTSTFFYPFALTENAHQSKLVFNVLSIGVFLLGVWMLMRKYPKNTLLVGLCLPIIFFVPLRNQILFGQSYMLILGCLVLAFHAFQKQRNFLGGGLLSIIALVKIFPAIYAVSLAFKKQWRSLVVLCAVGLILLLASLFISGSSFWLEYVTEIMPNAFANGSTIDFRPNIYSVDTLLRSMFILDPYYNPNVLADIPWLAKLGASLFKAVVLGLAIFASVKYRDDLFKVLAIWVAALFLIQTRTGSYAQILWIIPGFVLFTSSGATRSKLLFGLLLLVVCNFPVLMDAPLLLRFTKLWATIAVAILIWMNLGLKFNYKYLVFGLVIMLPLGLKSVFSASPEDSSEYVLTKKEYSLIYDFGVEDNQLYYRAIGKNGDAKVLTDISVSSYDAEASLIKEGQVFLGERQLTSDPALKKKAVLINDCEVYFLTDRMSRRGMFTLKKINTCGL